MSHHRTGFPTPDYGKGLLGQSTLASVIPLEESGSQNFLYNCEKSLIIASTYCLVSYIFPGFVELGDEGSL